MSTRSSAASARRSGRRRGAVIPATLLTAMLVLAACAPAAQVGPDGVSDLDTSLAPAQTVAPAPSLSPVADDDLSLAPRVSDDDLAAQLVSAAALAAGGSDSLTFVFTDGAIPGYDIRYVDAVQRGGEDVVPLRGSAALAVTFANTTPAAGAALGDDIVVNTEYDLAAIEQVVLAQNVGGTITFGVGLSSQVPFTVTVAGDALTVSFVHPEG